MSKESLEKYEGIIDEDGLIDYDGLLYLIEIKNEWLTMWDTLEELNLTSVVRKNMAENGFTFETDNEV